MMQQSVTLHKSVVQLYINRKSAAPYLTQFCYCITLNGQCKTAFRFLVLFPADLMCDVGIEVNFTPLWFRSPVQLYQRQNGPTPSRSQKTPFVKFRFRGICIEADLVSRYSFGFTGRPVSSPHPPSHLPLAQGSLLQRSIFFSQLNPM